MSKLIGIIKLINTIKTIKPVTLSNSSGSGAGELGIINIMKRICSRLLWLESLRAVVENIEKCAAQGPCLIYFSTNQLGSWRPCRSSASLALATGALIKARLPRSSADHRTGARMLCRPQRKVEKSWEVTHRAMHTTG